MKRVPRPPLLRTVTETCQKDSWTPGEGDILLSNYWRDDRETATKCG